MTRVAPLACNTVSSPGICSGELMSTVVRATCTFPAGAAPVLSTSEFGGISLWIPGPHPPWSAEHAVMSGERDSASIGPQREVPGRSGALSIDGQNRRCVQTRLRRKFPVDRIAGVRAARSGTVRRIPYEFDGVAIGILRRGFQ